MAAKCLCITILSILWLPFFALFMLSGFVAAFNSIYEVAITDEVKGELSGVIEDVPVPSKTQVTTAKAAGKSNFVGVGDDPIVIKDEFFPGWFRASVKLELEMKWQEPVWFGFVTKAEKDDHQCGLIDSTQPGGCTDQTMTYSAGGPDTAESKVLLWDITSGSWYIAGGAPENGGVDKGAINVDYKITPTVMGGIQFLCVIACIVCGLFLIAPCVLCCVWKTKKPEMDG